MKIHLHRIQYAPENAIRPSAIGKKNWMFANLERAGRRTAAMQSLLDTAELNGFDPLRWLTETLKKPANLSK